MVLFRSSHRGQSLVELLVAIAVGAILFVGAATLIAPSLQINKNTSQVQVATALANELMNNVQVFAEGNWHSIQSLATSSAHTYFLVTSISPFVATSGVESIQVSTTTYTRSFYLNDVYRDSNGAVSSTISGNTYDPSTKQVTIIYNWTKGVTSTLSFYLSRNGTNNIDQSNWVGGPGESGPITAANSQFASSSASIKYSTPYSLSISVSTSSSQASCNGPTGSWSTTTALPSPLYYHSAVVNNGYIYTTGGYDSIGGTATSTVYYAQISSSTGALGSWSTTTALPSPLYTHSSVVNNGYIYTTGGYTTVGGATSTVYYAQISSSTGALGSWSTTTALPSPLYYHSAVVNNGYIYTTGGYTTVGGATSTVYYAQISSSTGALGSWSTTTALPSPLYYHSAVVNNGYIYTTGGYTTVGGATSTVYYAQISSSTGALGSWSTTTALPSPLYYHSAVVNNGYIYTTGGYTTVGGATSTVYYAQISSSTGALGSWSTTTALPSPLYTHSSVVNNGYIYTTGGYTTVGGATSTVYYASCVSTNTTPNISATTNQHFAWNDDVGWMDFYDTNTVNVGSTGLTGYASSSIGNISLDCHTSPNGNICGSGGSAAISLVQSKSGYADYGHSITVTLSSSTTAGNTLIVMITDYYDNTSDVWSVADNASDTYSRATQDLPGFGRQEIWYASNIAAKASPQITFTAGDTDYYLMNVAEYSGLATSNALDTTSTFGYNYGNYGYVATTTYASGAATTNQANELLIGVHEDHINSNTFTPSSGWTQVALNQLSADHEQLVQQRIVSSTASYNSSGILGTAQDLISNSMATFKAASGGGASTTYQVLNDGAGDLSGWAWNDDIGWISFCGGENATNCPGSTDYETTIDSGGNFQGWAWNDDIGWISFNCDNNGSCGKSNYEVESSWTPPSSNSTSTGELVSPTFDTGVASGSQINSVLWQGSSYPSSTVEFQIAVSNSSSGPWNFIGPDGTANTYFVPTGPGYATSLSNYAAFDNYRYFRYQILITAVASSSVVNNVVVGWSP